MSDLRTQIEALTAAEKAELLDALWESLETGAPDFTDEQRAELDLRMARYAQDPSDVVPWEQVKSELFKPR